MTDRILLFDIVRWNVSRSLSALIEFTKFTKLPKLPKLTPLLSPLSQQVQEIFWFGFLVWFGLMGWVGKKLTCKWSDWGSSAERQIIDFYLFYLFYHDICYQQFLA